MDLAPLRGRHVGHRDAARHAAPRPLLRGEGVLAWDLGATPLARIPRGKTPEETAAALNMDTLLAGFMRFVAAEAGQNSP